MRRFLLFLSLAGCAAPPTPVTNPTTTPAVTATRPAGHTHQAPHGGALVELGEEFAHLELSWQPESARLTVYVLDGEASGAVRLKQPELVLRSGSQEYRLKAVANSLSGESLGDTSQFEGVIPPLKGQSEWEAELVELQLKGQTFRAVELDFPHGHH